MSLESDLPLEEADLPAAVPALFPAQEDEFLELYDRYYARIYTYFRYRCADAQTCDDLAAQTFEQALVHFEDYDPARGPFVAWLFGIARNAVHHHYRRGRKFQWLSLDKWFTLSGNDPQPEEQAVQKDEQRRLIDAIGRLPDRQRDLLALKFSGGLNNREIATLTGLSEQNVAVIIHRSIQSLRKHLGNEEDRRD
jgi:RNA polymerase sigma-70 factor, ECF subfamily